MNSSNSRSSDNIMHPDDQWLEDLTGASDEIANDAHKMTTSLRSAMLEYNQLDQSQQYDINETELNRLLQRCRDEGLIKKEQSWWQRIRWAPALVAVATACLVLVVSINTADRQNTDETVYRGMHDNHAIIKHVSNPMQQATALRASLLQAGSGDVFVYQNDGQWMIKATLIKPVAPAIKAVLQKYRIDIPENGKLKVGYIQVK